MRLLYILIAYLLTPIACAIQLWRGLRDRSHWLNFGERFGFGTRVAGGRSIWVHAVSVGEVQAAVALVYALRQRYAGVPLVLTTVTPTGAQRARAVFGNAVDVRFIPYDLPGAVRRFVNRVRPRVAIILETELWPNLYAECGRRRIPLVLASARISPRSVGRYRLLARLFRETLSHGIMIAAQSAGDAERFRSIGASAERTHVTGNIKFDLSLSADIVERGCALRAMHAPARSVWVAGSTHAGEERLLLDAQQRLRAAGVDALLLLVPRHPNRFDDVAQLLTRASIPFVRRSDGTAATARTQVLLGDTLGELVTLYAAGDVAFVAGSLVPIGGHNLLEPAALGLPILTGPYNFNSEDIAALLISVGAAEVIVDATTLSAALQRLFADAALRQRRGALARAALDQNRGALDRLLVLLEPVIAGGQTA